jgi:hypothetical protein
MIKYKRFHFFLAFIILYLIVIIFFSFAYTNQWGNNPFTKAEFIFFMVLFSGILLGFYGLTITVTEKEIKLKFGIGFYTKKIDLTKIKSVSIKDSPFYYGCGIRIIPNGLLYKVNGRHAVELKLKNKKNVIQIGTNDLDNLRSVIDNGINKQNAN